VFQIKGILVSTLYITTIIFAYLLLNAANANAITTNSTAGNLTPLLTPGLSATVCPAGTAFGVTTQASLPPGYNTLPIGTMLCIQKLGHQTIPAILPTGTKLIMQVIASQPNQATCSAPSALALITFGIPPTPATTSLCVELV
jgi:hypothetical protein